MKKLFFIALLASHLYAFIDIDPACCEQELIEVSNSMSLKNPTHVNTYYQKHQYKLHWDIQDLNDLIKATGDPFINYLSFDYGQDMIEELIESIDIYDDIEQKKMHAKIDLLATDAFFSFSKDLSIGLIDWEKFQSLLQESETELVWEKNPKVFHYDEDLTLALKSNMLEVLFQRYLPLEEEYQKLVRAYHRYGNISFPIVDYGKLMKVGDYGYRASQLKFYLASTGDLEKMDTSYMEFPTFDEKLEIALKRFQKRHYLKETGELDRVTVLYTRKSVEKKRELIKLNIERHKLFAKIYDHEYMLINIPEFSLKYFQSRTLIDDIFVVVGREDRPTPIFSDILEYIVLNPSWIVPRGLMRKDYIPKLVSDPNALIAEHIHIHQKPSRYSPEINPQNVNWEQYLDEQRGIPYYFMQYPGVDNVLGQMKFIFPNKYNVYLHDTNSKSLTTLKYRLYSSGCLRLSKPYDLLSILSQHTKYSSEELVNLISEEKTVNVPLKKKVPIHIRYFTVFTDKSNAISFRKDFYGIDALQLGALR